MGCIWGVCVHVISILLQYYRVLLSPLPGTEPLHRARLVHVATVGGSAHRATHTVALALLGTDSGLDRAHSFAVCNSPL